MNTIEICKHWAEFYFHRYFFKGRNACDWRMAMKYHDKVIALMAERRKRED